MAVALGSLAAAPGPAAADTHGTGAAATAAPRAQTAETQAALSPADALALLQAGNARFVAGTTRRRDLLGQVAITSAGQYPFAAVLGCVDSRVPPELVFDTGIGDIFSARVAGNGVDAELLGSLEFTAKVAGVPLIVVLGHTECGAVKAACDGVELGHLTQTLALIEPALEASSEVPGPHTSKNPAYVRHVTETHARLTAAAIVERSPIVAERIAAGELQVVAALYDVATGQVRILDPS